MPRPQAGVSATRWHEPAGFIAGRDVLRRSCQSDAGRCPPHRQVHWHEKGEVALARKPAVVLHRMLRTGTVFALDGCPMAAAA
jgi:hypothetical protein